MNPKAHAICVFLQRITFSPKSLNPAIRIDLAPPIAERGQGKVCQIQQKMVELVGNRTDDPLLAKQCSPS